MTEDSIVWLEEAIANEHLNYFEYSEFNNILSIGYSAYAIVYRANWKNTYTIFALKSLKNQNSILKEVVNELKLYRKIHFHANILKFYGVTKTDTSGYALVLEYADSDTLSTYLNNHFNELEWDDKLRLALQLADAILCLHNYDIIHRDLHANNILVHQKNIKLADFGLSKKIAEASSNVSKIFGVIPYTDPKKFASMNYKLDKKSDIYGVGVIMWQISSGHRPFKNVEYDISLALAILGGEREKIIDGTPIEYSNLYTKCWKNEPNDRPDAQEVASTLNSIILKIKNIPIDNTNKDELPSQIWIKNMIKERSIKYIEWNELTHKSNIGSGHFGSVFKAYWSKTNNYVACKKLFNLVDIQNQIWNALKHEIQIHSRAHACENIIRFLGITQELQSNHYCMVMEYADGGDLRIYLEENFSSFDWDKKYQLAIDITNGLHYIHKENILHRDLHSKNIVIQKGRAKITDFGNSKGVETKTKIHKEVFGMAPYVAPELFNHSTSPSFSKKTDIYSLGVLFWELSSGYPPFKNQIEIGLIFSICNGTREQKIPNTPLDYYDLYTACWSGNPEERPIIEDVYDKLNNMLPKSSIIIRDKEVDIKDIKADKIQSTSEISKNQKDCEYSESIAFNFLEKNK